MKTWFANVGVVNLECPDLNPLNTTGMKRNADYAPGFLNQHH